MVVRSSPSKHGRRPRGRSNNDNEKSNRGNGSIDRKYILLGLMTLSIILYNQLEASHVNSLFQQPSQSWSYFGGEPTTATMATVTTTTKESGTGHSPFSPVACKSNPYLNSMDQPIEGVMEGMKNWLDNVHVHGAEAAKNEYYEHTHARFFPFEPFVKCKGDQLSCIGGKCRDDASKIVCGIDNLKDGCVIYSIGGNNRWEFENHVLKTTPCEVHTFDCTGDISRFRVPNHPRLHFHHVCLVPYTDAKAATVTTTGVATSLNKEKQMEGEMWTLLQMQQKLGHTRIDMLKMDIEGFELNIFDSWPELAYEQLSEQFLLPHQILVEIHYQSYFPLLHPDNGDFKTATDFIHIQQHLLRMGYVVVNRDDNHRCRHCTELTLIRAQCPNTGVYNTSEATSTAAAASGSNKK